MVFNKHDNLEGLHAPFGASKSSWLRYDDSKAIEVFKNLKACRLVENPKRQSLVAPPHE